MPDRSKLHEQLSRRALQLQTAAEISGAASSILDLDELLPLVVELICERFDFYYTGIFLSDREGRYAVLQAGTGEAGRQMVKEGHRLKIGGASMIGWCVANAQARIALDVGEEAVRFDNPLLPQTRSEMALPLISRGQTIGAMTIQSVEPGAFAQEDITVLQSVADQLANAIENARLFQERERRLTELAIVNEIGQALSSALELDRLLEVVHHQVGRLFDATNFYIATYEEGSDEWTTAFHLEGGQRQPIARYNIESGLTGYIIRSRQPVLLRSIEENMTFKQARGVEVIGEMARSWLGVPLIVADKLAGVMAIQNYEHENLYDEQDLSLFSTIAAQVANALDNLRLLEEARRRAERLAAVNRTAKAVSAAVHLDDLMDTAYQELSSLFQPDAFFIALYDKAADELDFRFVMDGGERSYPERQPLKGLTSLVVTERRPLVVRDLERERDRLPLPQLVGGSEYSASWVGVPMLVGERVIGVVSIQSYRPNAWDEEDEQLLYTIVDQVTMAVDSVRLFEETQARAEEMAVLNELGQALTTRLSVEEVLEEAYRGAARLLDIPNFYIGLYDPERDEIHFAFDVSESVQDEAITVISADQGLAGYIIHNRKSVLLEENVRKRQEALGIEMVGEEPLSWLGVPLIVGDQVLGVMAVQNFTTPRAYEEHQRDLLTAIASPTAIALQNAYLFEETRAALAEVEATHRSYLRRAWQDHLRQQGMLERSGFLYDRTQSERSASMTPAPDIWRPEMERALAAGSLATAQEGGDGGERSGLAVPITLRGQTFGVLGVESPTGDHQWTEDDIAIIEAVSDQLAQTLETARLFADTQRRAERERLIGEITAKIRASTDVQSILEAAAVELGEALGTSRALVRLGLEEPARHPANCE